MPARPQVVIPIIEVIQAKMVDKFELGGVGWENEKEFNLGMMKRERESLCDEWQSCIEQRGGQNGKTVRTQKMIQ